MVKLTLTNAKGGVGKTIITNLLADCLRERGFKILVVDLDPQANTTLINSFKFNLGLEYPVFYDGLVAGSFKDIVIKLTDNLSLIAGDFRTVQLEKFLTAKNKATFLNKFIKEIEDDYDYIFFDVPPTSYATYLNNALACSDYFIILTEATRQSFTGISQLYNAASEIQEKFNANLEFAGVLINRRENDVANFSLLSEDYNMSTDEMFFKTTIPSRTRIGKYSEHGIYNYPTSVKSKKGYDMWDVEIKKCINDVMDELLSRISVEFIEVK